MGNDSITTTGVSSISSVFPSEIFYQTPGGFPLIGLLSDSKVHITLKCKKKTFRLISSNNSSADRETSFMFHNCRMPFVRVSNYNKEYVFFFFLNVSYRMVVFYTVEKTNETKSRRPIIIVIYRFYSINSVFNANTVEQKRMPTSFYAVVHPNSLCRETHFTTSPHVLLIFVSSMLIA